MSYCAVTATVGHGDHSGDGLFLDPAQPGVTEGNDLVKPFDSIQCIGIQRHRPENRRDVGQVCLFNPGHASPYNHPLSLTRRRTSRIQRLNPSGPFRYICLNSIFRSACVKPRQKDRWFRSRPHRRRSGISPPQCNRGYEANVDRITRPRPPQRAKHRVDCGSIFLGVRSA